MFPKLKDIFGYLSTASNIMMYPPNILNPFFFHCCHLFPSKNIRKSKMSRIATQHK